MEVVYKYSVPVSGIIIIPTKHKILDLTIQHGEAFIWCLVNPDDRPVSQEFKIVGTGHPFESTGWNYVGSFHGVHGWEVWHLFKKESEI